MNRTTITTLSRRWFHHWPDAPDAVAFLRNLHRHDFKIRIEDRVRHGDREVEFFIRQRQVEELLDQNELGVDAIVRSKSCEMLAEEILKLTGASAVEVWEDGENGARVELT
jgi:hypothetical protein